MQSGDARTSWQTAHEALMELSRKRAGLDFEEGRWLLAAKRAEAHRQLGYGSFTEYVERLFGYAPRVTHDKLRVAAALEALPGLSQELREGGLSFSHVRELTRVAIPETESAWIEHARGCTSRQVEKLVSGHGPGSLPDSPREPELQRHVLRFEVSGETLATFREAVAKLRREAGEHLDDDATLLLLARHVLGGPTDDGRASYQVALDVCEDCGRARQCADGELIDVAPAVAAMAECDAHQLPSAHAGAPANAPRPRAAQEVPPATRRSVLRRDHHRCQVPGCTQATFVDVHHLVARADGGKHHPANLLTLCGAHHRAVHEGTLVIGGWGSALLVRHADGTPYGAAPSAPLALVQERAFRALRGLGFAERDARRALKRCMETLDAKAEPELEVLLRHCLELLTANASMKAS
jgi:hypothetical protein